jgi:cephalosporin hydroxylase
VEKLVDFTTGKVVFDLEKGQITAHSGGEEATYPFDDPRAFDIAAGAWLRAGWDAKYVYTFTWLGRPVVQLPDDLVRMQEVVYRVKPDVIVETGVAHGGSLIFYASLFEAMRTKGRVIGIDIEIRKHNRAAIEAHPLFDRITLVEGSSIDPNVVGQVKSLVKPDERVMVVLDANHSYAHTTGELNAYAELVSPDSYIVVCDGIMKDLEGAPRSAAGWRKDNPTEAAADFVKTHPEYAIEQPSWPFNESTGLKNDVTYWPGAWVRRVR